MKKILKILGIILLGLIILPLGFGIYKYQTDNRIRAMVNNDESKLYYFPSKDFKKINLPYTESSIEVNDSVRIFTYYFKTDSVLKANVFLLHGNGGNVSNYAKPFATLLKGGYNIYAVDWRGFGKSTGKPSYKGVYRDTEIAFNYFKQINNNPKLKTIVYGLSLGGQLAVKLTYDNPSDIDALVLDGSICSAQDIAMDNVPINYLKEKIKANPQKFNQDYVAKREIKKITNIPKLIIHSKNDKLVPFRHGEILYKNAKEPKIFWQTKTAHIQTLIDLPEEILDRIDSLIL